MRDAWSLIRRSASLGILVLCVSGLIYWVLPKNLRSAAALILAFLGTLTCCLWLDERSRRRGQEKVAAMLLHEVEAHSRSIIVGGHPNTNDSSSVDVLVEAEDGDKGKSVLLVEAKVYSEPLAKQNDFWKELPRRWELFSVILPDKVRSEAFEPAYHNMLEDYVVMRKFRGKWARRWLGFAFTVRTLFMVLDCLRVLLQSGAGKILLNFLPDGLRTWWRRQ